MKMKHDETDKQRRDFLQKSVATAAIAVTVPGVAVAGTLEEPDRDAQESDNKTTGNKAGYRLSPHVIAYYKSCMR